MMFLCFFLNNKSIKKNKLFRLSVVQSGLVVVDATVGPRDRDMRTDTIPKGTAVPRHEGSGK